MAGSRIPGPQSAHNEPLTVEVGTLCRAQSPRPGPTGITTDNNGPNRILAGSTSAGTASDFQDQLVKSSLAAIRRETGCGVDEALRDAIPILAQVFTRLSATPVNGAPALGSFANSSSGRRIGGLKDVFASLGVEFLPAFDNGSSELTGALRMGASPTGRGSWAIIEDEPDTATGLALAIAVLVRLILQGIVHYLRNRPLTAVAPLTVGPSQVAGKPEVKTGTRETVIQLVDRLRSSQLGDAFETWVSSNWSDLLKNPRLQSATSLRDGGGSSKVGQVISQRRPRVSPPPTTPTAPEPPTFPPDIDMSAQAATLIAAAAQGLPFCPM
jgi:hypothetical protein